VALLPTVKIQHGDSFAVINESDFDPKKHKLFGVEDAPKKSKSKGRWKKEEAPPEDVIPEEPVEEPVEAPADDIELPGDVSE
jgi:hypothetical protein